MSMLELIWRGAQVHGQLVLDKIPAALWVVLVRYVRNAVRLRCTHSRCVAAGSDS